MVTSQPHATGIPSMYDLAGRSSPEMRGMRHMSGFGFAGRNPLKYWSWKILGCRRFYTKDHD